MTIEHDGIVFHTSIRMPIALCIRLKAWKNAQPASSIFSRSQRDADAYVMLKRSHAFLVSLAIAVASLQATPGQASGMDTSKVQSSGLTADQAKKILVLVLKHEKLFISKPGFNVEATQLAPGYMNFFVTYDSPNAGATDAIGSFAVSPRTGDVWETNICRRYTFPALERAQAAIMKRTGETFASEVSERRKLGCTNE